MRIDPTVLAHIEKFIELARKHPDAFWKKHADPKDYRYHTGRQRKYVHVRAGGFMFKVDAQTGQVCDGAGRRSGRHGNIAALLCEKDWKRGRIKTDRNCVPVNQGVACEVCGRTAGVRATALGQRCQYCRGADSRHIGSLRRLGAVPMLDGRPLGKYLKDG